MSLTLFVGHRGGRSADWPWVSPHPLASRLLLWSLLVSRSLLKQRDGGLRALRPSPQLGRRVRTGVTESLRTHVLRPVWLSTWHQGEGEPRSRPCPCGDVSKRCLVCELPSGSSRVAMLPRAWGSAEPRREGHP